MVDSFVRATLGFLERHKIRTQTLVRLGSITPLLCHCFMRPDWTYDAVHADWDNTNIYPQFSLSRIDPVTAQILNTISCFVVAFALWLELRPENEQLIYPFYTRSKGLKKRWKVVMVAGPLIFAKFIESLSNLIGAIIQHRLIFSLSPLEAVIFVLLEPSLHSSFFYTMRRTMRYFIGLVFILGCIIASWATFGIVLLSNDTPADNGNGRYQGFINAFWTTLTVMNAADWPDPMMDTFKVEKYRLVTFYYFMFLVFFLEWIFLNLILGLIISSFESSWEQRMRKTRARAAAAAAAGDGGVGRAVMNPLQAVVSSLSAKRGGSTTSSNDDNCNNADRMNRDSMGTELVPRSSPTAALNEDTGDDNIDNNRGGNEGKTGAQAESTGGTKGTIVEEQVGEIDDAYNEKSKTTIESPRETPPAAPGHWVVITHYLADLSQRQVFKVGHHLLYILLGLIFANVKRPNGALVTLVVVIPFVLFTRALGISKEEIKRKSKAKRNQIMIGSGKDKEASASSAPDQSNSSKAAASAAATTADDDFQMFDGSDLKSGKVQGEIPLTSLSRLGAHIILFLSLFSFSLVFWSHCAHHGLDYSRELRSLAENKYGYASDHYLNTMIIGIRACVMIQVFLSSLYMVWKAVPLYGKAYLRRILAIFRQAEIAMYNWLVALMISMYVFAVIGCRCYGGKITTDPSSVEYKELEGSEYEEAGYWPLNFNDMFSALLTLFLLLYVNNMQVTASGMSAVTTTFSRWYFIAWYVLGPLFLMNILTALIWSRVTNILDKNVMPIRINKNHRLSISDDLSHYANEENDGDTAVAAAAAGGGGGGGGGKKDNGTSQSSSDATTDGAYWGTSSKMLDVVEAVSLSSPSSGAIDEDTGKGREKTTRESLATVRQSESQAYAIRRLMDSASSPSSSLSPTPSSATNTAAAGDSKSGESSNSGAAAGRSEDKELQLKLRREESLRAFLRGTVQLSPEERAGVLLQFARRGEIHTLFTTSSALRFFRMRAYLSYCLLGVSWILTILRLWTVPIWLLPPNQPDSQAQPYYENIYNNTYLSSNFNAGIKIPLLCVLATGLGLEWLYKMDGNYSLKNILGIYKRGISYVVRQLLFLLVLLNIFALCMELRESNKFHDKAFLVHTDELQNGIWDVRREGMWQRIDWYLSFLSVAYIFWFDRYALRKAILVAGVTPRLLIVALTLAVFVLVGMANAMFIFDLPNLPEGRTTHDESPNAWDDDYVEGYYPVYSEAIWSGFVMTTSSSFPNQLMPPLRQSRTFSVFALFFIGIGAFVLLESAMATVNSDFQNGLSSKEKHEKNLKRGLCRASFSILSDYTQAHYKQEGEEKEKQQDEVAIPYSHDEDNGAIAVSVVDQQQPLPKPSKDVSSSASNLGPGLEAATLSDGEDVSGQKEQGDKDAVVEVEVENSAPDRQSMTDSISRDLWRSSSVEGLSGRGSPGDDLSDNENDKKNHRRPSSPTNNTPHRVKCIHPTVIHSLFSEVYMYYSDFSKGRLLSVLKRELMVNILDIDGDGLIGSRDFELVLDVCRIKIVRLGPEHPYYARHARTLESTTRASVAALRVRKEVDNMNAMLSQSDSALDMQDDEEELRKAVQSMQSDDLFDDLPFWSRTLRAARELRWYVAELIYYTFTRASTDKDKMKGGETDLGFIAATQRTRALRMRKASAHLRESERERERAVSNAMPSQGQDVLHIDDDDAKRWETGMINMENRVPILSKQIWDVASDSVASTVCVLNVLSRRKMILHPSGYSDEDAADLHVYFFALLVTWLTAEVFFKMLVLGWKPYIREVRNKVDFFVALFMLCAAIAVGNSTGHVRDGYFEAFEVFTLIRVLLYPRNIACFASPIAGVSWSNVAFVIAKLNFTFVEVFLCLFFTYAQFGVWLFGGTIPVQGTIPKLDNSPYGVNDYYSLTFNDLTSSFYTLFTTLRVSDFDTVTSGFSTTNHTWVARMYFLGWYVLGVMLCHNIIRSYLVSVFKVRKKQRTGRAASHYQKTQSIKPGSSMEGTAAKAQAEASTEEEGGSNANAVCSNDEEGDVGLDLDGPPTSSTGGTEPQPPLQSAGEGDATTVRGTVSGRDTDGSENANANVDSDSDDSNGDENSHASGEYSWASETEESSGDEDEDAVTDEIPPLSITSPEDGASMHTPPSKQRKLSAANNADAAAAAVEAATAGFQGKRRHSTHHGNNAGLSESELLELLEHKNVSKHGFVIDLECLRRLPMYVGQRDGAAQAGGGVGVAPASPTPLLRSGVNGEMMHDLILFQCHLPMLSSAVEKNRLKILYRLDTLSRLSKPGKAKKARRTSMLSSE